MVIFSNRATVSSIVISFLQDWLPNGLCFLSPVSALVFEACIVFLSPNKLATAIKRWVVGGLRLFCACGGANGTFGMSENVILGEQMRFSQCKFVKVRSFPQSACPCASQDVRRYTKVQRGKYFAEVGRTPGGCIELRCMTLHPRGGLI